jgi:type II secretory pathway component HofQ
MRWVRGNRVRLFGVLLLVASLISVGLSYRATAQTQRTERERQRFVACQARYNDVNNERTRALTEAGDKERVALRRVTEANAALWLNPKLIRAPGAPIDPAVLAAFHELQAALTIWRIVEVEVDKERKAHPVPPPPRDLCGRP